MLVTELLISLHLKKDKSLNELASLFYSAYINKDSKSTEHYTINYPSSSNSKDLYHNTNEGQFNGPKPVKVISIEDVIDQGIQGLISINSIKFVVDDFSVFIESKYQRKTLKVSLPTAKFQIIFDVLNELNVNIPQEGYNTGLTIAINSVLARNYFNRITKDITLICDAFDLPKIHDTKGVVEFDHPEEKILKYSGEGHTIKLTYKTIRERYSKSESALIIVEINQTISSELPSKFELFFSKTDYIEPGQKDFNVDRCHFRALEYLNAAKSKNVVLSVKSYLMFIDAI